MTKEEAIKYLQEIYPHGGHCWLDEQRIEAISMAIDVLSQDQGKPEWIKELEAKLQSVSKDEFQKIMQKYEEECDLKEEPISEDLNTELDKYIKDKFTIDKEQLDRFGLEEKDYMYSMDKSDMLKMASYFANWQKKKDYQGESDMAVVAYMDGVEKGKKMMREQIM